MESTPYEYCTSQLKMKQAAVLHNLSFTLKENKSKTKKPQNIAMQVFFSSGMPVF